MRRRPLIAATLSLAMASTGLPAIAQDLKGEALKQFQDGKALKDAGNCKDAISRFEKSLQLQPDQAGTLFYLAQCDEALGLMSSAYTHYTESELIARKLSADPSNDKKVKVPHDAAQRVAPKVDHVKIVAPTPAPAGLEIRIGESVVASSAWDAIPVDPGTYTVHANAPGKQAWAQDVKLSGEGKTETVTIGPLVDEVSSAGTVAATAAPTTAPTTASGAPDSTTPPLADVGERGGSQRTIGIVVGIAGVAIAGVGVIVGLGAKSKMTDSKDNHCGAAVGQSDPNRCDATGLDLRDSARGQADLATVLLIAGGAAAATGLVLILTGAPKEGAPASATASLRIAPGGVVLGGAF